MHVALSLTVKVRRKQWQGVYIGTGDEKTASTVVYSCQTANSNCVAITAMLLLCPILQAVHFTLYHNSYIGYNGFHCVIHLTIAL